MRKAIYILIIFSAVLGYQYTRFVFDGGGTKASNTTLRANTAIANDIAGNTANTNYSAQLGWTEFSVDTTAVSELEKMPEKFEILSVYPNPFNSSVVLKLFLPKSGRTEIEIVAIDGRKIHEESVVLAKGLNHIRWTPKNISSGVYFLRIRYGTTELTDKIVLIK